MATDIDERVVEMKFNNAQFESGTKQSLSTLDKLKAGLNLDGASKSLSNLQATADRFHLGGIADGVETIAGKFSALGIAGVTAMANIANRAVDAGVTLVKSLTIDPIKQGFDEYETNLNSVQTILANTQSSGAGLKDVNAALNDLNLYSDKTIYNFSEMAHNIGTFTAAGVGLKPATAAIKGIANLAALSGSNSQQASSAMYQLSQAISSGRVGLQDWNSVVNAGMGGTVFQRALARTAVTMGTLKESALKLSGPMKNVKIDGASFRDSISAKNGKPSWLSSDVLTKTLAQFTGDMKDSQLATMGFTKAQIASIQAQAKTAQAAATQVKTFSQLIGTLQESVGSGWAQTSQLILGDFGQAKTLFTGISNTLGGMISAQAKARNKMLTDWAAQGGRRNLLTGLHNAFDGLMNVIKPVTAAFHDIFPPTTGKQLNVITVAFGNITRAFKEGTAVIAGPLERTFKGLFAVLDIGRFIIVEVIKTVLGLFGEMGTGGAGILDVTANIGDFLVKLHDVIVNGGGVTDFFKVLGSVLKVPIIFISSLVGFLAQLATGLNNVKLNAFGDQAAGANKKITPFTAVLTILGSVIDKIKQRFAGLGKGVGPALDKIGTFMGNLGKSINDGVKSINWDTALTAVQTGFFGALTVLVGKSIFGKKEEGGFFASLFKGFAVKGGFLDSVKGIFKGITGSLEEMQNNLKSKTLLNIAIALGILTISMVALSLIDSSRLTAASAAMGVMFAELAVSMKVMETIARGPSIKNIPIMAAGLILLSIAVSILAKAVVTLAQLDWNELARGLTGLIVVLGGLIVTSKAMSSGAQANLIKTGLALIPFAIGIKILGSALTDLSGLSWGDMATGLTGIAGVLVALALYSKFAKVNKQAISGAAGLLILGLALKVLVSALADFATLGGGKLAGALLLMSISLAAVTVALRAMPKNMLVSGIALVTVASGLKIMAGALQSFGGMKPEQVAQAIAVLAATLFILVTALEGFNGTILGAASLLVAAAAINVMVPALQALGAMDMDSIGKALGVLAASLIIIAGSLYLMEAALPGAAALLVAAAALLLLAPAMAALGAIPLAGIGTALLALAGVFLVLGVGALALTAIIPILVLLGAAIFLLGAGVGLAGAGVFLLAGGLTALGVAGAAGIGVLILAIKSILDLLPSIATSLGNALAAFASAIGDNAPKLINSFVQVLTAMLDGVDQVVPKIIKVATHIIVTFLDAIGVLIPKIVSTGFKIVVGIVSGIADNIGKLVDQATRLIVNFINGIARGLPKIIQAGANLLVKFIEGIAQAIDKNSTRLGRAGGDVAAAMIRGMVNGIGAGVGEIAKAVLGMGSAALTAIKTILGIHSPSKEFEAIGEYTVDGFVNGLTGKSTDVTAAFKTLSDQLKDFADNAKNNIDDYIDKVEEAKAKSAQDVTDIAAANKTLNQAKSDRRKGTSKTIRDEQSKLKDLTAARKKDTREIKDAKDAVAEYAAKASGGKTAAARASAAKSEKNAKERLDDLTAKRKKDTKAIAAQQKVVNKAIKDNKNGVAVTAAQLQLDKLKRQQKRDTRDLNDDQLQLTNAQVEGPKAEAAYNALNTATAAHADRLRELSDLLEQNSKDIDEQTKKVEDAKQTRDDYNKSLTGTLSTLQDIADDTQVSDYFSDLEKQITNVNDFSTAVQDLRARGLNDTAYQKLLAEGPSALPFVRQLQNMGDDGVQEFNNLTTQLGNAASALGTAASTSLYQAGVDSAQGLLDGLNADKTKWTDEGTSIANQITQAVKDALGIKSPSKVFYAIGEFSTEGLANGLSQTSGVVTAAAEGVGNDAVGALQKSMSDIGSAASMGLDTTPTIRPVLDLTSVQKDAGLIGGILGQNGLSVDSSYNSATSAANGYDANQDAVSNATDTTTPVPAGSTVFNQYNNSPKSLSASEIYRQTKNQLSQVKGG